jgi:hypothetical protein
MSATNNNEEMWEEESYQREEAVSNRHGGGTPMDPVVLASLVNGLSESEMQDCLEDYYHEENNPIF